MNDIDDASPKQRWKSRYALDGCKESPVISPFSPLGELDLYRHVCVDADAAKGYLQRAADNDIAVPEFVQDGLRRLGGERVRRNMSDKIEKQNEPVDEVYAGEIVWIPTKVGKQSCYWPGIALNLDRDRGLIPDVGMKVRKADQTAETHRFAIYFGDKTFEWVKADTLLDFLANAERLKIIQKGMLSRTTYAKALDIAFERLDKQMSTTDHARRKMHEHNKHVAENRLKERLGSLHDTPPTTCGKCNVCLSRSREREELPFSKRHLPRASAKPTNKPALKGVKYVDVCPQLQIITRAKKGSIGAQLALMRERAVGQRIIMYWHMDNTFYPATIAAFDELHYLHRIEHDDGDIEPAVKLWEAQLNLKVEDPIIQTPPPIARQRANTGSPKNSETIRSSVRKRIPRLPYDSDHQTQKRTRSDDDDQEGTHSQFSIRRNLRRFISFKV